jgi:hypothetical protein
MEKFQDRLDEALGGNPDMDYIRSKLDEEGVITGISGSHAEAIIAEAARLQAAYQKLTSTLEGENPDDVYRALLTLLHHFGKVKEYAEDGIIAGTEAKDAM